MGLWDNLKSTLGMGPATEDTTVAPASAPTPVGGPYGGRKGRGKKTRRAKKGSKRTRTGKRSIRS